MINEKTRVYMIDKRIGESINLTIHCTFIYAIFLLTKIHQLCDINTDRQKDIVAHVKTEFERSPILKNLKERFYFLVLNIFVSTIIE